MTTTIDDLLAGLTFELPQHTTAAEAQADLQGLCAGVDKVVSTIPTTGSPSILLAVHTVEGSTIGGATVNALDAAAAWKDAQARVRGAAPAGSQRHATASHGPFVFRPTMLG